MVRLLSLLLPVIFLTGCREELVHVSSELEANKVMLGLRVEGIDARKAFLAKEWVIDVPQARLTDALKILEDKRVFREDGDLDANINSSDLFSSRQEKEARANKLVASSLSSTLRVLPGVLDARVHIYQNISEPFALDKARDRTASVLLVVKANTSVLLEQVKELVSRGGGLHASKVSVVLLESPKEESGRGSNDLERVNELPELEGKEVSGGAGLSSLHEDIPQKSKVMLLLGLVCLFAYVVARMKRGAGNKTDLYHDALTSLLEEEENVA